MVKPRLLLHTCCAPCVTYVAELLSENYDVTAYFYNPNIYPINEYEKRRDELITYTCKVNLPLLVKDADFDNWYSIIKGLEKEPEGGKRCFKCYEYRMNETAKYAKENNFDLFTTSLSISPHKIAPKINEIGLNLEAEHGIKFLESDFKKNNGFKKSCDISRQFNLYRQYYCGCEYSIRKKN